MWRLAAALTVVAAAGAARAETAPDVWRTGPAGSARHLPSGLICPGSLGGMPRVTVAVFDAAGRDVACGYAGDQVALTIYLTQGGTPDAAMAAAKTQFLEAAQGDTPALVREEAVRDGDLTWRRAIYGQGERLRSDIWIAGLWGWVLKYRTTYPVDLATETARAVETASRAVTASAGPRLAACAQRPETAGC